MTGSGRRRMLLPTTCEQSTIFPYAHPALSWRRVPTLGCSQIQKMTLMLGIGTTCFFQTWVRVGDEQDRWRWLLAKSDSDVTNHALLCMGGARVATHTPLMHQTQLHQATLQRYKALPPTAPAQNGPRYPMSRPRIPTQAALGLPSLQHR
jgi:hypothetical protein